MKKLLSYLITLIVGLIGGIYCHNKVMNTAIDWINKYFENGINKKDSNRILPYSKCFSFDFRQDAERMLSRMIAKINNVGIVTVADLMIWSGLKHCWNDEKFGWTDLSKVSIYRENERYYIDLPEASPIYE